MADIESTLKKLKADWKNFSDECKQAVINLHASNPSPCDKDVHALLSQAHDIKSVPENYTESAMEFADDILSELSAYAQKKANKKA